MENMSSWENFILTLDLEEGGIHNILFHMLMRNGIFSWLQYNNTKEGKKLEISPYVLPLEISHYSCVAVSCRIFGCDPRHWLCDFYGKCFYQAICTLYAWWWTFSTPSPVLVLNFAFLNSQKKN